VALRILSKLATLGRAARFSLLFFPPLPTVRADRLLSECRRCRTSARLRGFGTLASQILRLPRPQLVVYPAPGELIDVLPHRLEALLNCGETFDLNSEHDDHS
jgi:hypothetical protein